jgi:hypothetical protein
MMLSSEVSLSWRLRIGMKSRNGTNVNGLLHILFPPSQHKNPAEIDGVFSYPAIFLSPHSHSIVAGGLDEISYATRLMPLIPFLNL